MIAPIYKPWKAYAPGPPTANNHLIVQLYVTKFGQAGPLQPRHVSFIVLGFGSASQALFQFAHISTSTQYLAIVIDDFDMHQQVLIDTFAVPVRFTDRQPIAIIQQTAQRRQQPPLSVLIRFQQRCTKLLHLFRQRYQSAPFLFRQGAQPLLYQVRQ